LELEDDAFLWLCSPALTCCSCDPPWFAMIVSLDTHRDPHWPPLTNPHRRHPFRFEERLKTRGTIGYVSVRMPRTLTVR
jgi:hypothetical protein